MPCIIKDGVLQKYRPYCEEKEIETKEGIISLRVAEVGVKVPTGVVAIGPRAFAECDTLLYVELPDGVTDISAFAFKDCKHLKQITLPATLRKVGAYAFSGCRDLTEITLPEQIEQVGSYAFSYCQSLKSVAGLSPRTARIRGYELFLSSPNVKWRS